MIKSAVGIAGKTSVALLCIRSAPVMYPVSPAVPAVHIADAGQQHKTQSKIPNGMSYK